MKSFKINLVGEILEVQAQDDYRYTILKQGEIVCDIQSATDAESTRAWSSLDPISEVFTKQISELIVEHEM